MNPDTTAVEVAIQVLSKEQFYGGKIATFIADPDS